MRIVFALLIAVASVAAVQAQKVKVAADPSVDVSKFKTYAWNKTASPGNPLVQQAVVQAVDEALAAKGLTKVENDAELIVAMFTATDSDLNVAYPNWSNAMGTALSTGIYVGPQTWTVTKGTLFIDIENPHTKSSVWHAQATHTLEHGPTGNVAKDAKSVDKPIRKAVEKMFKQFPRPK